MKSIFYGMISPPFFFSLRPAISLAGWPFWGGRVGPLRSQPKNWRGNKPNDKKKKKKTTLTFYFPVLVSLKTYNYTIMFPAFLNFHNQKKHPPPIYSQGFLFKRKTPHRFPTCLKGHLSSTCFTKQCFQPFGGRTVAKTFLDQVLAPNKRQFRVGSNKWDLKW